MKHRFRIITNDHITYPYLVQKKGWIFWNECDKSQSLSQAKDYIIRRLENLTKRSPGTVVEEYSDEDFLADKLKGNFND